MLRKENAVEIRKKVAKYGEATMRCNVEVYRLRMKAMKIQEYIFCIQKLYQPQFENDDILTE